MNMKSRHNGISVNRLDENPREKVFHKAWKELNRQQHPQHPAVVDYLAYPENNVGTQRPTLATDDECRLAATIIQWLGSPIGWSWLQETLSKIKD